MQFAEKLNLLMSERSLSKYKLSKDLSFSATTITNWLDNLTKPSSKNMKRLADYFSVEVDSLMDDSKSLEKKICTKSVEIEISLSDNEKKLLDIFRFLSEDNQAILIGEALKLKKEQTYEEIDRQYKQAK